MSQIDKIVAVVNQIGSLPHGASNENTKNIYIDNKFVDQNGNPSQGKFLQAFAEALNPNSPLKNKLVAALDSKLMKSFLSKVTSASKYPEIENLVKGVDLAAEDTTTANVAAYPVPIGMMRSKHKDESVKSVCAYEVDNSVIDEDLNEIKL